MKSTKKILALLLAMVMLVTVFAACGGDDSSSASSEASSAETSGTSETSEASTSETAEEEEPEDDGTIYPVRIVQPGTTSTDNEAGLAAVNEKLKEDGVNVEVSMIKIPWDSYDQRLNLMLSTGEAFEMLHVMQDVKNLSAIVGMGALLPKQGKGKPLPACLCCFCAAASVSTYFFSIPPGTKAALKFL